MSWPDAGTADTEADVVSSDRIYDAPLIVMLFEEAFEKCTSDNSKAWLSSVETFWKQRGYLTSRQYDAVERQGKWESPSQDAA